MKLNDRFRKPNPGDDSKGVDVGPLVRVVTENIRKGLGGGNNQELLDKLILTHRIQQCKYSNLIQERAPTKKEYLEWLLQMLLLQVVRADLEGKPFPFWKPQVADLEVEDKEGERHAVTSVEEMFQQLNLVSEKLRDNEPDLIFALYCTYHRAVGGNNIDAIDKLIRFMIYLVREEGYEV